MKRLQISRHLMWTLFQGLGGGSASLKVELVDLTTPEPTHDDRSSDISTHLIIDSTPTVIDLGTVPFGEGKRTVRNFGAVYCVVGDVLLSVCNVHRFL
jgi:hypothetical protein